jgi:hypothetical protein
MCAEGDALLLPGEAVSEMPVAVGGRKVEKAGRHGGNPCNGSLVRHIVRIASGAGLSGVTMDPMRCAGKGTPNENLSGVGFKATARCARPIQYFDGIEGRYRSLGGVFLSAIPSSRAVGGLPGWSCIDAWILWSMGRLQ